MVESVLCWTIIRTNIVKQGFQKYLHVISDLKTYKVCHFTFSIWMIRPFCYFFIEGIGKPNRWKSRTNFKGASKLSRRSIDATTTGNGEQSKLKRSRFDYASHFHCLEFSAVPFWHPCVTCYSWTMWRETVSRRWLM